MPDRDWQKDWELCREAREGPWQVVDCGVEGLFVDTVKGIPIAKVYVGLDQYPNAQFIAAAREGWPEALEERARLAERVRELEDEVKLFRKVLVEVWCICRQRAPKCTKLLVEVKRVINTLGWEESNDHART